MLQKEVSETSWFRQMLHNLPSSLLPNLNAGSDSGLRDPRITYYSCVIVPFTQTRFGEPVLCSLGHDAASPVLESHGP